MARESRYALRLPSELYDQIKSVSDGAGISMNEFIVRALTAHFDEKPAIDQRLTELERRVQVIEASHIPSSAVVYPPDVRLAPGE